MEIQDEQRPNCPVCNSNKVRKDSVRKTLLRDKQRWFCKACGKRFVNSPIRNIKGDPKTVVTVMDLYMKGVSYRSVADHLKQIYGLEVSHITVMNWVNTYLTRITEYVKSMQPQVGDYWFADEQFIKVKGNQQYVWNVLDNKTRFLLASNASKTRCYEDARRTFKKAKKTAGKKAKTVVTDGSFNYSKAVRKEFATYQNPKPHKRYVSLRQKSGNNNKVERFHETFRQRDKVMRGFKGNQKQYAENFQTYYNFVRKHSKIGMTPAQKAKIDQKADWKELLLKAMQSPVPEGQTRLL